MTQYDGQGVYCARARGIVHFLHFSSYFYAVQLSVNGNKVLCLVAEGEGGNRGGRDATGERGRRRGGKSELPPSIRVRQTAIQHAHQKGCTPFKNEHGYKKKNLPIQENKQEK